MVNEARTERAKDHSETIEIVYKSEEVIEERWKNAVNSKKRTRARRRRASPPQAIIARYSKYLCMKGTVGLLLDDEKSWGIYLRGCEFAAYFESLRLLDEVAGAKTGSSIDPHGVRLMAALFMLGRLDAAKHLIESVLPITWEHRLNIVESKEFSIDEIDLASEHVLDDDPEGRIVGYQLPYSYDLCGLDPMLLSIISRSLGLQINFPGPPDFCELKNYAPAVDSLEDDKTMKNCLDWMCRDREVDGRTQRDWVIGQPAACFDVPVEVLAVMKARQLAGFSPIEVEHQVVAPPFHQPPSGVPDFTTPLVDRMIEWAHEHRNELASAIFS